MNNANAKSLPAWIIALVMGLIVVASPARAMMPAPDASDNDTAKWLVDLKVREQRAYTDRAEASSTHARSTAALAPRRTLLAQASLNREPANSELAVELPVAAVVVESSPAEWTDYIVYGVLLVVAGFLIYVVRHIAQEKRRVQELREMLAAQYAKDA